MISITSLKNKTLQIYQTVFFCLGYILINVRMFRRTIVSIFVYNSLYNSLYYHSFLYVYIYIMFQRFIIINVCDLIISILLIEFF